MNTTALEVYWPSCSLLFYNNPDDCPIACFGSLAPANCELGVLPKLVEKNGMYFSRGRLYTCFELGFLSLVSIKSNFIYFTYSRNYSEFQIYFLYSPCFPALIWIFSSFLKSFSTPKPISHFSGISRGKGGEREEFSNNCRPADHSVEILTSEYTAHCLHSLQANAVEGTVRQEASELPTTSTLMCLL